MSQENTLSSIKNAVFTAIKSAETSGEIKLNENISDINSVNGGFTPENIGLEPPREKAFGDFATNISMKLCRNYSLKPLEMAEIIKKNIKSDIFSKIEVKAPGFINFYLSDDTIYQNARNIVKLNHDFGKVNIGGGKPTNVEFGSINPTGPISVSHGRQVVLGDVFSSLLEFTNHKVTREYYCNDTGNQIRNLGRSVVIRYREILGEPVAFPEDGYHGDYVIEIAREVLEKYGEKYRHTDDDDAEAIKVFGDYAQNKMLKEILDDCAQLRIKYDTVYSEKSLHDNGLVEQTLDFLKKNGLTYEKDGATWFLSTKFGDDKDRVLVKSDSSRTYALNDIAYHKAKYDRGFEYLINFLGADHHGYTQRLYAAIEALGKDRSSMRILLHQFVTMLRDGQVVRMSKRAANFVVLSELVSEAGADATRYFFLMRKMDAHLEFDINLAKSQSTDNPVYYVQYCHARCNGILKEAQGRNYNTDINHIASLSNETIKLLNSPEEMDLLKKAYELPKIVEYAVKNYAPHLLCHYAEELTRLFQSFYTKGKNDAAFRVVTDNRELTEARLFLISAVMITIRNVLGIMNVNAPERM